MKVKIISISIMLVVLSAAIITYTIAQKRYYPEPAVRNSALPSDAEWNSEAGEYYNSKDFRWNSEKQQYEEVVKETSSEEKEMNEKLRQEEALYSERAKDYENVLDRAIKEYKDANMKYLAQKPKDALKSFNDYTKDEQFKIITDLGVKYLPEMLYRVENEVLYTDVWMNAIYKITNVKVRNIPIQEYAKKEWLQAFKQIIKSSPSKVKDASEKLKKSKNKDTVEQVKNNISDLGLFTLPYIMDEVNAGNHELIEFLPEITEKYSKISKDELSRKDADSWKSWFKEHEEDIKILSDIVKGKTN